MHAFFILGVTAFVICLITTPLCRDLFLHAGLVDQPDSDRKFHQRAVPRIGGISIALSYASSLALVFFFPSGSRMYVQHRELFHALLPAASVIFAVGLLDDLWGLKPWQKLLGQLIGAGVAISLGLQLHSSHLPAWTTCFLSFIWLIGCSNAVNLIDGLDGLATGVGLLATLSTLLVALISGNVGLALATVPLAGCLLAFLRYNFSPATIFLGDCGSLTIGFVLGCFGLAWSQRSGTMLGMLAPLMALSLPLIDVLLAIGRRYLRNVPILKGDRGHIHHRLVALGLSNRGAALLLYAVCALAAALAILESFSRRPLLIPIAMSFAVLALFGVRHLRYVEFTAARTVLSRARHVIHDYIYLHELTLSLERADTLDGWWQILCTSCIDLSVASVHLELDGHTFDAHFLPISRSSASRIDLGLGERGVLVLTLANGSSPPPITIDVLHRCQSCLEQKSFVLTGEMISRVSVHASSSSIASSTAA